MGNFTQNCWITLISKCAEVSSEQLRLGTFDIPEVRLYPNAVNDVKKVIESKVSEIGHTDLAKLWKYARPNTGSFYRRLNALLHYRLLESGGTRGRFRVTQLAKDLYHPHDEGHRKQLYKQAVMNIDLWKELYNRVGKNPPESIYVNLKELTGAEPSEIEKVEKEIRKWYLDDIALVPEEIMQQQEPPKHLSSTVRDNTSLQSMSASQTTNPDSFGTLTIQGIGSIDITPDTIDLAELALQRFKNRYAKKEEERSTDNQAKGFSE